MTNKGIIAGAVAGSVLLGGLAAYELPTLSNYNRAIEASVVIGEVCSGTVIEDPITSDGVQLTVLTAKHCQIGITSGIVKVTRDDESALFTIAYISEDTDLMLLQSDMPVEPWTTVVIADDYPTWGSVVYNISHPAITFGEVLTEGRMGEILMTMPAPEFGFMGEAGPFIIATPPTIGGSSGSGLFNDNFELIALLSGGEGDNINVWTAVDLPE